MRRARRRTYPNFNAMPFAIARKVSRTVTYGILVPQLQGDLLEGFVHFGALRQVKGFASGKFSQTFQSVPHLCASLPTKLNRISNDDWIERDV